MDLYEITNVITNMFGTYVIYKLLTIFFDDLRTSKKAEVLSYVGYYLINTTLFLLVRIPAVITSTTLLLFFCISLNYHSTLKKRIIFSLLTYMILLCIEVLVGVLFGSVVVPLFEYSEDTTEIGLVLIQILSLLAVTILKNLKSIKDDIPVPNFYWFSTIFISVASLYQLLALLEYGHLDKVNTVISIIIILCINIIVLLLYDNLYKAFAIKSEKLLLEQQNKAYVKQLETMEQSAKTTQIIRHDMKNHMITLKSLHSNNENDDFSQYVDDIIAGIDSSNVYSKSGNYVIDSILNFKLQVLADMKIVPEIEITIPEETILSAHDITVVLGNLIDNATQALAKCQSEKHLSISIKYSKCNIIISITNSFDGQVKKQNGSFRTMKSDSKVHGIGLKSVNEIVKRNHGHIEIEHNEKTFNVTILLPIE